MTLSEIDQVTEFSKLFKKLILFCLIKIIWFVLILNFYRKSCIKYLRELNWHYLPLNAKQQFIIFKFQTTNKILWIKTELFCINKVSLSIKYLIQIFFFSMKNFLIILVIIIAEDELLANIICSIGFIKCHSLCFCFYFCGIKISKKTFLCVHGRSLWPLNIKISLSL